METTMFKPTPTEDTLVIYKSASEEHKQLLEAVFGKEALNPKQDLTWKELFKQFCEESKKDYDTFMKKNEDEEDDDLAYKMIKAILAFKNGNWNANIKDKSQKKWHPWFYWDDETGFAFSDANYCYASSYSYVGSRLYSQSEAQCIEVSKKYLPIYKKFYTYL